MNHTSMTKDEHLDMLKRAIIANLDARIERDIRRKEAMAGRMPGIKLISGDDLIVADEEGACLESLISDPVLSALRQQLQDLGWRLFRLLGTTNAMLPVAYEAANAEPERSGRRINIIDKAWDGIGEENDYWLA
jgi:hypothetical protein